MICLPIMKKKLLPVAVVAIGLALWGVLGLVKNSDERSRSKKNLLLITIDTMRADRIGCYGDAAAHTPAIDALAREGVLFKKAYSPAPLTLPAHCSIMNGRWPIAHGVRNNVFYALPEAEITLAETLSAAGYDTSAFVASYVLKKKFGLGQGFSFFDDYLGAHAQEWGIEAQITADILYKRFTDWLQRPRKDPFFLWVHLYDPHKPYTPPADFLKTANGDAYRGEVAFVDHIIGQMISDLRRRELLQKTMVVVVGDHGEAFGEHVEKGHGIFCYEESVLVPLIFSGPGLAKSPIRVTERVRLIDVMPTVLEMLGVAIPQPCQGKSLARLMSGNQTKEQRPVYLESLYGQELNNWAPLTSLISGHWKYISLPQAELYDLNADPGEKENLFLKRNPEARRFDKDLAAFIASHRGRIAGSKQSVDAIDLKKLEALGYISSFASSGKSGIDPKIGIAYQERCTELFAAFDRGEIKKVEAEALRLKEETREYKFPFAYVLLHHVYEKKKQWNKVEANLLEACSVFQDQPKQNVTFQRNLLEFYFAVGNLAATEKVASEMVHTSLYGTRPLEILGDIAKNRGQWQQALGWFLRAQEAEEDNYQIGKKVLQMRMKLKDAVGIREGLDILLAAPEGRKDPDLLFTAAMIFIENDDYPRAETLLARLIEIESKPSHWVDFALVLARTGKMERAIAGMEKALAAPAGQLDEERRQAALRALKAWKAERPR